jgi:5-methylthioribose kinase
MGGTKALTQTGGDTGQQPDIINIEDFRILTGYLRTQSLIDIKDEPSIRGLGGGVSNHTVLVEPSGQPPFVVKQARAKLRVESDWFSSPDRIHREALGMRWLRELAPPGSITSLLFEDTSEHIIVMSAVPQPHLNWKEMLLTGVPQRDHFDQFALILGQVHARSHDNPALAEIFGDRSNFESLRLEPYYRYSAKQVPEAKDFIQDLIEETLSQNIALVHGDYSPKNILVGLDRFVLVDHEVIHYGDPAFDVGFSLAHLLAKAAHRPQIRHDFLIATRFFASQYLRLVQATRFGVEFESRACRHAIACLLARVVGRSPFEYLTAPERQSQKETALRLLPHPPQYLSDLIERFAEE